MHSRSRLGLLTIAAVLVGSCGSADGVGPGPEPGPGPEFSLLCSLDNPALFDGGAGRGGIPSLLNPPLVPLGDPAAQYIEEYAQFAATDDGSVEARVIGMVVDGVPIAVPHNILWHHEVVNLDFNGSRLAVTYCPLTGSALVFDVTASDAGRLNVSGLIFENNLVMWDEQSESLWPQLCLSAVAGPRRHIELEQVHAVDQRWDDWKSRFPNSLVLSSETGFDREYARYPYRFYEQTSFLLFPMSREVDSRRPIKERVFGLEDDAGGIAFPLDELAATSGERLVIAVTVGGRDVVVLWNGHAAAVAAFYPVTTDGTAVTLRPGDSGFIDVETGSTWVLEGVALDGPMAGSRLQAVPRSFVAYWFAWAAFHPQTAIWTRE